MVSSYYTAVRSRFRGAFLFILLVRVLRLVQYTLGSVEFDLAGADTDVLEHIDKSLAVMSERNRTVMRIVAVDKCIAVEPSHFLDGEYAGTAE